MNIIKECPQSINAQHTVITIGTFDGIHKGHQKILQRLNQIKQQQHLQSIVFTFYPHPRKIISSHQNPIKILTTLSEKIDLFQQYNLDYLIVCPFNQEFANQLPEDFVHYLVKHLNMKYILIGYDHRFGKNRSGSIDTFLQMQDKLHFQTEQISAETINEINISSTKIRQYLTEGLIEQANLLLGYDYFISGKVIKGKQLGTQIGIPTANISIEDKDKLIPKIGVYAGYTTFRQKKYQAAINIGYNPTTDNNHLLKIEAHLIGFNQNIYGEYLQLHLTHRIRDEKKFNSIQEMITQIHQDIKICEKKTII